MTLRLLATVATMHDVIHDIELVRAERLVEQRCLDAGQLMESRGWLHQARARDRK